MPYIVPERRTRATERRPATAGELNYAITMLVCRYLGLAPDYTRLNEVIGVLECAKQELYRRVVAPYEDRKAQANGDLFGEDDDDTGTAS